MGDPETASTDAADIELEALVKRCGGRHGRRRDRPSDEFFTLLGPSGSGKTTTLRLIAGFELPDSGEVRLRGNDVARLSSDDGLAPGGGAGQR